MNEDLLNYLNYFQLHRTFSSSISLRLPVCQFCTNLPKWVLRPTRGQLVHGTKCRIPTSYVSIPDHRSPALEAQLPVLLLVNLTQRPLLPRSTLAVAAVAASSKQAPPMSYCFRGPTILCATKYTPHLGPQFISFR